MASTTSTTGTTSTVATVRFPSRAQRAVAMALGTTPIMIGASALYQPAEHLKQMNLAQPTAPSDQKTVDALLSVFGIRQLFMGAVLVLGGMLGSHDILGGLLLFTAAIAVGDAAVVYQLDIGGHENSLSIAALIAIAGLWVLRSR